MVDIIIFSILMLLYLVLLELSKNAIYGWFVAIFIAIVFFVTRYRYKKENLWTPKNAFITWSLAILLCFGNYFLTEPPVAATGAVNLSNPVKTDTISLAKGELCGVYNLDQSVAVYAGIPYAKPPVGELRWKEPEEPEGWDGLMTCDHFGPRAMQTDAPPLINSLYRLLGYHDYEISFYDNYIEPMSEDCLYLNIWQPAEALSSDEKLPVLFYIHGGSLTDGKSYDERFRGETLAKKGVIVVTVGYRLNVFGYLATDELAAESANGTTGNYGLLDQIAALKWVNENIEAFGGDNKRITIAGESAGASSVNAICVSPLAKGLFSQAIADSSSILPNVPYHTFRTASDALETGSDIMKEMGCSTLEEMRALPAETLVKTAFKNSAMMVDGYAITEQPCLTYEKGNNNESALLNGFNGKEADTFLMDYKATNQNYIELLRDAFGDYAEEVAEIVPPDSYPQTQKFLIDKGGEAKGALNHAYSAAWFTYSHYLWSNAASSQGLPVYEYYFTKKNDSLSDYHGGELVYFFGNQHFHQRLYTKSDTKLSETMQDYWVNFIKTGDPNKEGLPQWLPVTAENKQLLELGDEIRMTDDPFTHLYGILDIYQSEKGAYADQENYT